MNPAPNSHRRTARHLRGVTLIEACIALAMTSIAATTATPGLQSLIDGRRLEGTARQLATDIAFVRSEAVARNQPLRLTLSALGDDTCYVLHSGPADACTCQAAGPAVCAGDALEIKTVRLASANRVALQSNAASVLFDPLHGTASPTATLRVLGSGHRAVHQIVNVMGRVRSCSPAASMPGHPAC